MRDNRHSRVSEAIWPWPDSDQGLSPKQEPAPIKRVLLQAAVLALLALLLWRVLGHVLAARVVLALAVISLVTGILLPGIFRHIERFGKVIGRGAGVSLTWALLVPFFYLCFIPARLILLLLRKDPLHRSFPSTEASYWVSPPHNAGQHERQF
jgi:hypothetical protein